MKSFSDVLYEVDNLYVALNEEKNFLARQSAGIATGVGRQFNYRPIGLAC